MKEQRAIIILLVTGLFIMVGMSVAGRTLSAEPIELKFSHFGPQSWVMPREVFEPWTKKVESLTNGRVKFAIFPRDVLGTAGEQYDLAIKGTADIAASITDYTPGRFPLSSVMDLPFLGESGKKASLVFWSLYKKYLQDEFKEVKVLWLWCHGPGQIHTVNKPIKTLEDLKGLRIRVGYSALGKALERLGAIPVVCDINQGYELLKEGKVDGVVIPWEAARSFGIIDFCKYHTEINMYTMPFFAIMNKTRYESLPVDIKKVIDDNSGEAMAVLAGETSDREDARCRKFAQDRGDFFYVLPKSELERWRRIAMPVGDAWVKEMTERKGLPGDKVLAYVVDLFMQLQQ